MKIHEAINPIPTEPSQSHSQPRNLMKKNINRVASYLWREWLLSIVLFFSVVAPLRSAIVDWNWVPTGSMKPTIVEGDLVLVNKLAYDLKIPFTTMRLSEWANPARGEIAVFFSPKDGVRMVKRVIGVPGDTIELRNEILYLNGQPQRYSIQSSEPFSSDIFEDKNPLLAIEHLNSCDHYVMGLPSKYAMRSFGPLVITANNYFMMGDSRDNSFDSRYFGLVNRDLIVGRTSTVLASFDTTRFLLPRIHRFIRPLSIEKLKEGKST